MVKQYYTKQASRKPVSYPKGCSEMWVRITWFHGWKWFKVS